MRGILATAGIVLIFGGFATSVCSQDASRIQEFNVSEAAAPGSLVGRLAAESVSDSSRSQASYAIATDGVPFRIDPRSGELTLGETVLDFEQQARYVLSIRVRVPKTLDAARRAFIADVLGSGAEPGSLDDLLFDDSEQSAVVTVADAPEPPRLAGTDLTIVVRDRTEGGQAQLAVRDPDAGDTHTFALIAGDLQRFSIDPQTGRITWRASADAHDGTFPLTVRVTDSTGLSDAASINVEVIDPAPIVVAPPPQTELSAATPVPQPAQLPAPRSASTTKPNVAATKPAPGSASTNKPGVAATKAAPPTPVSKPEEPIVAAAPPVAPAIAAEPDPARVVESEPATAGQRAPTSRLGAWLFVAMLTLPVVIGAAAIVIVLVLRRRRELEEPDPAQSAFRVVREARMLTAAGAAAHRHSESADEKPADGAGDVPEADKQAVHQLMASAFQQTTGPAPSASSSAQPVKPVAAAIDEAPQPTAIKLPRTHADIRLPEPIEPAPVIDVDEADAVLSDTPMPTAGHADAPLAEPAGEPFAAYQGEPPAESEGEQHSLHSTMWPAMSDAQYQEPNPIEEFDQTAIQDSEFDEVAAPLADVEDAQYSTMWSATPGDQNLEANPGENFDPTAIPDSPFGAVDALPREPGTQDWGLEPLAPAETSYDQGPAYDAYDDDLSGSYSGLRLSQSSDGASEVDAASGAVDPYPLSMDADHNTEQFRAADCLETQDAEHVQELRRQLSSLFGVPQEKMQSSRPEPTEAPIRTCDFAEIAATEPPTADEPAAVVEEEPAATAAPTSGDAFDPVRSWQEYLKQRALESSAPSAAAAMPSIPAAPPPPPPPPAITAPTPASPAPAVETTPRSTSAAVPRVDKTAVREEISMLRSVANQHSRNVLAQRASNQRVRFAWVLWGTMLVFMCFAGLSAVHHESATIRTTGWMTFAAATVALIGCLYGFSGLTKPADELGDEEDDQILSGEDFGRSIAPELMTPEMEARLREVMAAEEQQPVGAGTPD